MDWLRLLVRKVSGIRQHQRQVIHATVSQHLTGVDPFVHGFLLGIAYGDPELSELAQALITHVNLTAKLDALVDLTPREAKLLRQVLGKLRSKA